MTTKEKFVRDRLLCAARFAAIFAAAASASTCALASDTVLHSFTGSDGANPYAGLASDGSNLYGVTFSGGSSGQGVVFELPLSGGTLTTLCTFAGSGSGAGPTGTPVLDSSNNVYGTAAYASLSGGLGSGNGIVFKCPSGGGVLSSLHTFGGGTTDGANPFAGLVTDGSNLYGTTFSGGSSSKGIAFKLPLSGGTLTILHSFTGGSADGASPYSSVALNSTNLFGTTTLGGSTSNEGVVFELPSSGGSSPTYPHRFILGNGDGTTPRGNVILDSSGNIFGTTSIGGSSGKE